MQRSKVEMFAHMVWTTRHREPFLEPDIEQSVHRCIAAEVVGLNCIVLSLNGTRDHVHLVVSLHSTVAVARLAQAVKVNSSRMANDELGFDGAFDWQDNYGAFSVSRSHLERVMDYVRHQKERHASGKLWPAWEETHIEVAAS